MKLGQPISAQQLVSFDCKQIDAHGLPCEVVPPRNQIQPVKAPYTDLLYLVVYSVLSSHVLDSNIIIVWDKRWFLGFCLVLLGLSPRYLLS